MFRLGMEMIVALLGKLTPAKTCRHCDYFRNWFVGGVEISADKTKIIGERNEIIGCDKMRPNKKRITAEGITLSWGEMGNTNICELYHPIPYDRNMPG